MNWDGCTVVAGLEDAEGALVAHADQAAHGQLEDHVALEGDKVADVLQDEEARPVEVAVAQVGDDQRVAEGRVLARVEAVHAAETLARRPSAQQIHLHQQQQQQQQRHPQHHQPGWIVLKIHLQHQQQHQLGPIQQQIHPHQHRQQLQQ